MTYIMTTDVSVWDEHDELSHMSHGMVRNVKVLELLFGKLFQRRIETSTLSSAHLQVTEYAMFKLFTLDCDVSAQDVQTLCTQIQRHLPDIDITEYRSVLLFRLFRELIHIISTDHCSDLCNVCGTIYDTLQAFLRRYIKLVKDRSLVPIASIFHITRLCIFYEHSESIVGQSERPLHNFHLHVNQLLLVQVLHLIDILSDIIFQTNVNPPPQLLLALKELYQGIITFLNDVFGEPTIQNIDHYKNKHTQTNIHTDLLHISLHFLGQFSTIKPMSNNADPIYEASWEMCLGLQDHEESSISTPGSLCCIRNGWIANGGVQLLVFKAMVLFFHCTDSNRMDSLVSGDVALLVSAILARVEISDKNQFATNSTWCMADQDDILLSSLLDKLEIYDCLTQKPTLELYRKRCVDHFDPCLHFKIFLEVYEYEAVSICGLVFSIGFQVIQYLTRVLKHLNVCSSSLHWSSNDVQQTIDFLFALKRELTSDTFDWNTQPLAKLIDECIEQLYGSVMLQRCKGHNPDATHD